MRLDLHMHTNLSDGRLAPEAVVWKASARNLDAIAITDHDTTAAVAAAQIEGASLGVRVIPGCELSVGMLRSPLEPGGRRASSAHLIVLGFDLADVPFQDMLAGIRASRRRASLETVERLALAGFPVHVPEHEDAGRSLCRPHLADALIAAGHARNRQEAFERFLGSDTYRSDYALPTAEEAIRIVHRAGGVAIYAHPHPDDIDRFAPLLKEWGLDGIEVYRSSFRASPGSLYAEDTARRLDLLVSGGSDWHGTHGNLGEFFVTEDQVGPLARSL